jgi:hypothetical protein
MFLLKERLPMKRLIRPSTLLVLVGVSVVTAVAWVFYSTQLPSRPVPPPIPDEDREIAWLNAATSTTAWQRFVQAIVVVTGVKPGAETFPHLSTSVPEIAVPLPGQKGKLRIRWYKLTSEWNTRYWLEALVSNRRTPLAIIGGNTTDSAIEQAQELRRAVANIEESQRPILLLTTATADRVPGDATKSDPDRVPLTDLIELYPNRSFRFCFSNRQIGESITRFIWSQDDLRPDAFPVYSVEWKDDPYSADLIRGFLESVEPILTRSVAAGAAADWGLGAGTAVTGGFPLSGLTVENFHPPDTLFPMPTYIPWSVGSFDRPNAYEAAAALNILEDSDKHPRQRRCLLVLSGQSGPSRRLVRGMCRLSPIRTRRFVLASGDAIAFNTILRDRNVTWPIQDLPCSLLLFCHNNPVGELNSPKQASDISGTEDLLLYQDMVDALILASTHTGKLSGVADQLRDGLRLLRVRDGRVTLGEEGLQLFDSQGNRRSGTGEHVVWLRPTFHQERVLPEAQIVVATWQAERSAWVYRGQPIRVFYTGARAE